MNCGGFFDVETLQKNLAAIEGRMGAPDFWSNRERAQNDVEEVSRLRSLISPFQDLEREIEDFSALQQLRRKRRMRPHAPRQRKKSRLNTRG